MEPLLKAHFDLSSEHADWERDLCPSFSSAIISRPSDLPNTTLLTFPRQLIAADMVTLLAELKLQLPDYEPELMVDFGAVKRIETAALVTLLQCVGEVLRRDGVFTVRSMSPEAATFIELTGLDDLIEIPSELDISSGFDFVSAVVLEDSSAGSAIAA